MNIRVVMRGDSASKNSDETFGVGGTHSLKTTQKDLSTLMGTKGSEQKAFNKMLSKALHMFAMKSLETLAHPPKTWNKYIKDGDVDGIVDMETGELMEALLNDSDSFDVFKELSHTCAAMMMKYGYFGSDQQDRDSVADTGEDSESEYGRDDDTQMMMRQYVDAVKTKNKRRIGYVTNRNTSGATV